MCRDLIGVIWSYDVSMGFTLFRDAAEPPIFEGWSDNQAQPFD
jgi:hypothetical protein